MAVRKKVTSKKKATPKKKVGSKKKRNWIGKPTTEGVAATKKGWRKGKPKVIVAKPKVTIQSTEMVWTGHHWIRKGVK